MPANETWNTWKAAVDALLASPPVSPCDEGEQATGAYDAWLSDMQDLAAAVPVVCEVEPPDPPDPPSGQAFVHGVLPVDGFKGSTLGSGYRFRPNYKDGQRLFGTITVPNPVGAPAGVTYRLLVDGVPQATLTIDTTQWPNGSHVLQFQVVNANGQTVHNGSRVVIFNNSGVPFTSPIGQAVVVQAWSHSPSPAPNSLAWGRVNVLSPTAYPLGHSHANHPNAETDADRQKLATQKVWWVEGLNHPTTPLWQTTPILAKNAAGDYFVQQYNPEGGGSGNTSINALPFVEAAPAYDGPRGVGWLSPYTTLVPGDRVLASGDTGWLGVDLSGRVMDVDITGEVTTVLGPRSVGVGTDPNITTFTLAQRIAAGEKEYVGDANGLPLKMPQDIWICNLFTHEGIIADTGNNRIAEIDFGTPKFPGDTQRTPKLMRSWTIPGVSSVCATLETQRDMHIAWFAVNPQGLWLQRVNAGPDHKRLPDAPIGPDGKVIAHLPQELVASIPNAFWVRGNGLKIYVLTLKFALYEVDATTLVVTERKPPETRDQRFVFMAVDTTGVIGPTGRIYYGGSADPPNAIRWIQPDTLQSGSISSGTSLINRNIYGNWIAQNDPFGHYLWGFAPHKTMPKFVSTGITNSSWLMWSGHLGPLPVPDPALPSAVGTTEFRNGKLDEYLPLASIFGYNGHGSIGYTVDQFRDLKTYAEAQPVMRAALDPLFPPAKPEADRENETRQMFVNRTRKHFQ